MTSVVEIPGCSVAQLLDATVFPLKEGTLQLVVNADTVVLRLDKLAFPLSPDTPVFTHSHNPLWYFFRGPTGASGSYVRITLPSQAATEGTEDHQLRDRFEDALIQAGLLTTGIEVAGDEIDENLKEDAAWISGWITSEAAEYTDSRPATDEPVSLSSAVQSMAASASSGSAAAVGYASTAAQVFARTTIGVGSRVFSFFGGAVEGEAAKKTPDVTEKLKTDLAEAGYAEDGEVRSESPHPFHLQPIVDDAKAAASTVAGTLSPAVNAAKSAVGGLVYGKKQDQVPRT